MSMSDALRKAVIDEATKAAVQKEVDALVVEIASEGVTSVVAGDNVSVNVTDPLHPVITATPSGSTTQVQFNDGGKFAGDAGMTYNKTTDRLTVGAITSTLTGNVTGNVTGYIILPTSDPLVAGALWNNNGTVTISAGPGE